MLESLQLLKACRSTAPDYSRVVDGGKYIICRIKLQHCMGKK